MNRPPWEGLNIEPRFGNNFIDANVLDRGTPQHDAAVERILSLVSAGEFTLLLPHSVKGEIQHPNTPPEVKRRAAGLIYSMPVELTAPELATHERIRALVRGNAESERHASDAFHLVEAAKYGGRHFITNDKRLLKKALQIWTELQLRVLTAQEFIDEYYPDNPSGQDGSAMQKRQIVSREELDHYLTSEIRKIEDLEDARLESQYVLREPDEDGCNWSGAVLRTGAKGSAEYAAPYAQAIVQKARAQFNLKE